MTTVMVEIPEQQVVSMVEQLSISAKHEILKQLIADYDQWNTMVDAAEERMRALCTKRGLDWDRLDEEQRLQLIDTLLHGEWPAIPFITKSALSLPRRFWPCCTTTGRVVEASLQISLTCHSSVVRLE